MKNFSRKNLFSLEFLLLVAIAVAVILRILNLGSREFWYDEVLSLLLSTGQKGLYQTPPDLPVSLADYTSLLSLPIEHDLSDIVKTLINFLKGLVKEPHPPLFFLEQHFWLRLFGNGEIAMRSLVALFSIAAMGAAYGLGRLLLGYRGGLLFAALLGLNPYYLFHSLNVRMYASIVFWIILSSWSLLELIQRPNSGEIKPQKADFLWILILIGSVTAGFMTFYYFACFFMGLAILVLWLDRRRWWQYGLCFATSILITVPWLLWGTRQQLRNADLERFAASGSFLEVNLRHLQELFQVLGTHLILGDWVSILPPTIPTLAGIGAIALLIFASISLWRTQQRRLLGITLLLGVFPLLLMLGLDVLTHKFTLGFGWGRSVIFVLPGCLLLEVSWIERSVGQWKRVVTVGLLLLYLSINLADFGLRSRWMFHQIADIIQQSPNQPTLIVINSPAWGHILRLAYYLPPDSPIMLLAQKSEQLTPALQKTLTTQANQYQRVIWLDSAKPVWGKPSTEDQRKQVQNLLQSQFKLEKTQPLVGTWELDNFTLNLYQKNS